MMAGAPGCTILLVEEDDLLRRALARLLTREGYRVLERCGDSGSAAELVVLGLDAARADEIVARFRHETGLAELPLLVIGGDARLRAQLGRRSGPTAYLPRLFGGSQFLATVRAFLGPPQGSPGLATGGAERGA
jgi:DNA-binding response OmpR family regulator